VRACPWARPCLLVLAIGVACRARPADPVAALLADVEAAAEARDADAILARLSEGFRDEHGLDRTETGQQVRRWLAAYESVSLEVYGVEIERAPGSARVRCVVEFAGRGRSAFGLGGLLPPEATYRFTLDVADEGGTWRVRGVAYEPASPAGGGAGAG
jgi:hypothetical protein